MKRILLLLQILVKIVLYTKKSNLLYLKRFQEQVPLYAHVYIRSFREGDKAPLLQWRHNLKTQGGVIIFVNMVRQLFVS